jgi:8-oxo-dGTP pyrophosphatase MutT (NUDIX family)
VKFTQESTSTLGEGLFVRLERLSLRAPDGTLHPRDVLRHPGGVAVLPVDGDRVWLVKQYRVALDRHILEIPAGKRDVSGEPPIETARRELAEELGMEATEWVSLGTMAPSPGYTDEIIHLFAASGIVAGTRKPDGAEEMEAEVVEMSLEDALTGIDDDAITDAKTQIALLRWSRRTR